MVIQLGEYRLQAIWSYGQEQGKSPTPNTLHETSTTSVMLNLEKGIFLNCYL